MEETTLIKFFNGSASPKEEKEVREWLEKPESRKEFDLILEKHFENPAIHSVLDELDYTNLLAGIHKKITPIQSKPKRRILPLVYKSLRIAASIVLVLFLGYVMVQTIRTNDDPNNSQTVSSTTTITRSTGPGEKLTLQMPDKTKIVINALSEISFSSDYGQKERIIHLTGEAYFEVASDPNRPFKVVSDGITTTALGTQFNVFNRDLDIKIALVEGKVAVSKADHSIELRPGLMASLDSKKATDPDFLIQTFDLEKTVAWKEGLLIFDGKPVKEILKDLENWYSVSIQVEEGIDLDKKLIGSYNNKSLEDILTGLSFSLDFNFTIDGKNVQLTTIKP